MNVQLDVRTPGRRGRGFNALPADGVFVVEFKSSSQCAHIVLLLHC